MHETGCVTVHNQGACDPFRGELILVNVNSGYVSSGPRGLEIRAISDEFREQLYISGVEYNCCRFDFENKGTIYTVSIKNCEFVRISFLLYF